MCYKYSMTYFLLIGTLTLIEFIFDVGFIIEWGDTDTANLSISFNWSNLVIVHRY